MTRGQIEKYLRTEAVLAGIASNDIADRVDSAIDMGLRSFWGSWNWYFKMREVTFTTTTVATNYDPPKDYGGLIKIVQQADFFGDDLEFLAKEEFDRRFPKPGSISPGRPVAVTTYQTNGKWKLQFYPQPTVQTDFNLVYEIGLAFAVEQIPEGFADGLNISCAKYIYPLGSREGLALEGRWQIIKRELQLQNTVHKKPFNNLAIQGPRERRLPRFADQFANVS